MYVYAILDFIAELETKYGSSSSAPMIVSDSDITGKLWIISKLTDFTNIRTA